MQELELSGRAASRVDDSDSAHFLTLREVVAIIFRRRRLILLSFFGVLLGAILTAVLQPNLYDASMKILVQPDRPNPVVNPEGAALPPLNSTVTEEELNSEVALLKSRDLLEQIVVICGLQHPKQHLLGLGFLGEILPAKPIAAPETSSSPYRLVSDVKESKPPGSGGTRSARENVAIAGAVLELDKDLKADVVKKSNLIEAAYASPDPQLAARVLSILASLYLEKHVEVHRPRGAFDFFQRETEKYRQQLSDAEQRLKSFDRDSGVVSATAEKELTLQKLADFQVVLSQTNAAIAETQERTRVLEHEMQSTPTRMVTQVRDADDGLLVSQLKANLLNLEQKRTELLTKFEPTYRSVQEVDAEIAQVKAAIAEKSQIHEQTTDRDPTYEWTRGELAKANADLASLKARAQVTNAAVEHYEQVARELGSQEVEQDDLVRTIKATEESYLLSLRKEEEARISDALDRGRMLNVAIAEPPTVPALPSNHRLRIVLFGFIFAILASAGLAFAAEHTDPTFRTPGEVGSILNIPVLASIPQRAIGEGGSTNVSSLLLAMPEEK